MHFSYSFSSSLLKMGVKLVVIEPTSFTKDGKVMALSCLIPGISPHPCVTQENRHWNCCSGDAGGISTVLTRIRDVLAPFQCWVWPQLSPFLSSKVLLVFQVKKRKKKKKQKPLCFLKSTCKSCNFLLFNVNQI